MSIKIITRVHVKEKNKQYEIGSSLAFIEIQKVFVIAK